MAQHVQTACILSTRAAQLRKAFSTASCWAESHIAQCKQQHFRRWQLLLQGRSGLPAAVVLQQLHTALADIEQLKTDLLSTAQPQPTEQTVPAAPAAPAEQAVPAVPAVPAVSAEQAVPAVPAVLAAAGKKRLRRQPATGANAQTRPGLYKILLHPRLGYANQPALAAVPTADAATQSEQDINAGTGEQSAKTLNVVRSQIRAEQSYGRSSISRRHQGGHYSEQPCLRAQREKIVPGQLLPLLYNTDWETMHSW